MINLFSQIRKVDEQQSKIYHSANTQNFIHHEMVRHNKRYEKNTTTKKELN